MNKPLPDDILPTYEQVASFALLAFDSFFHLSKDAQRQMFPIFAQHLRPGGALMMTTGPNDGEAIGHIGGEAPVYHASLAPEEYRHLFEAHGFKVLRFSPEDPECGRSIWLTVHDIR